MNINSRLSTMLKKIPAFRTSPAVICRLASTNKEDVPTHTGQVMQRNLFTQAERCLFRIIFSSKYCLAAFTPKWSADDYRLARFENAPKQVNPNWAINLIAEVPPKKVKQRVVWCDGGSGPEGHPRVYINLDKPGNHSCGYCGLRFEKEGHH